MRKQNLFQSVEYDILVLVYYLWNEAYNRCETPVEIPYVN